MDNCVFGQEKGIVELNCGVSSFFGGLEIEEERSEHRSFEVSVPVLGANHALVPRDFFVPLHVLDSIFGGLEKRKRGDLNMEVSAPVFGLEEGRNIRRVSVCFFGSWCICIWVFGDMRKKRKGDSDIR